MIIGVSARISIYIVGERQSDADDLRTDYCDGLA